MTKKDPHTCHAEPQAPCQGCIDFEAAMARLYWKRPTTTEDTAALRWNSARHAPGNTDL